MYEYLKYHGLAGIVVATKSDKISRNEAAKTSAVIRRTLGMKPEESAHRRLVSEKDRV